METTSELKLMVVCLSLTLLVPVVVVLGLTWINRSSKNMLTQRFGNHAIVIVGGLGIITHELSHLLMAIVFGHHINDARLIIFGNHKDDGTLGYVNHSWNPNSRFQSLGNALIGTAPIYGCTALLIVLTWWLVPTVFQWGSGLVNGTANGSLLAAITAARPLPLIAWVLLSINITVGGFDLSNADIKSALPAAVALYLIIAVLLCVLILIGLGTAVVAALKFLLVAFTLTMLVAFFWSLLVNLLCRISKSI